MLTNLSGLLTTLIALSVAAERLVSIVKNFSSFLSTEKKDTKAERKRQACLQILAVGAGLITALLAVNVKLDNGKLLSDNLPNLPSWPLLGLLASGGSSFWTSILGYANSVKDIQKNIAIDTHAQATANLKSLAYREATRELVAPPLVLKQATAVVKGISLRYTAQPLDAEAKAIAKKANDKLNAVIEAGLARL